MPLSDAQLRVIRSWVGDRPTGEDLEERFSRLGDVDAVILETMRSQLSRLLESPSSFSTPDGVSMSTGENIRALKDRIAEFTKEGTTGAGVNSPTTVTRLVRNDPR